MSIPSYLRIVIGYQVDNGKDTANHNLIHELLGLSAQSEKVIYNLRDEFSKWIVGDLMERTSIVKNAA
uniref:Phage protein n=1 Tax=Heterorhabditis bacteriophora TaxID=37862 RepID=A0A1I7WIC8_HETBA